MSHENVLPAETQPAAVPSRALRIGDQPVARDPHRIVALDLLDGRVLRVLEVGLDRVETVGPAPAPVAAGRGLVIGIVFAAARIPPPESDLADHPFGSGGNGVGQSRSQGLEQHLAEPHRDFPAPDDGSRPAGVHGRTRRSDHLDQLVQALVDRNVRVQQAFQNVDAGGEGLRQVAVHGRRPLPVRSGEVEPDAAAVQRHPGLQVNGPVADPVVVQPPLGFERPPGQALQFGPGAILRVLQQLVDVEVQGVASVTVEQGREAPHSHVVGGDLRPKVSGNLLFRPHVGQEQLPDLAVDLAAGDQLHHRQNEPLLVDLAKGADAGRGASAHVHVMAGVGDVTGQLVPVEERGD